MAQLTTDWILQRIYGSPHTDGYGSQHVQFNTNVKEVNLGRNCVYRIDVINTGTHDAPDGDGYAGLIDGYRSFTESESDWNQNAESSITDSACFLLKAGTTEYFTTNINRHVLSIKRPDGSTTAGEVFITKMEPGKSLKDDNNSA